MAHWPRTEAIVRALQGLLATAGSGLLVAATAVAGGPVSPEAELGFARHGQPVTTRGLAALRQAVEASTVRVFEPYEQAVVPFRAMPFDRVLDAVYSPSWRQEQEILFTCRDGYQPSVPVQRLEAHDAWLAFDRDDREGFAIRKRESGERKRIELGPFYLVWENLDDEKIRQESDYGWPYQLVGVDLIRTVDRFPKLMPPEDAPAQVRAGFDAFRVHCNKCHALNGQGGSIGPELNAASSPIEYRERDWLRTWIEDPSRIRPDARMPALNPELPDRAATVDAILAYLQVMRDAESSPDGG